MKKFKIGDCVKRERNAYDKSKGYKLGKVTNSYSKPYNRKTNLGPYPELYSVLWQDGVVESGFLPHGLDAI